MNNKETKDLHVSIKKKFEQPLRDEFDLRRRKLSKKTWEEDEYYIEGIGSCPLCNEYLNCQQCPFDRFSTLGFSGCYCWIDTILEQNRNFKPFTYGKTGIRWRCSWDEVVQRQIKKLKRLAHIYIEWI